MYRGPHLAGHTPLHVCDVWTKRSMATRDSSVRTDRVRSFSSVLSYPSCVERAKRCNSFQFCLRAFLRASFFSSSLLSLRSFFISFSLLLKSSRALETKRQPRTNQQINQRTALSSSVSLSSSLRPTHSTIFPEEIQRSTGTKMQKCSNACAPPARVEAWLGLKAHARAYRLKDHICTVCSARLRVPLSSRVYRHLYPSN